jgi:hypothetical protein
MQASTPLPENIVRELESAIDRLNDDFDRVEFWAAALNAFLQPIPRYEAPDSDFLLGHKNQAETGAMEVIERRSAGS